MKEMTVTRPKMRIFMVIFCCAFILSFIVKTVLQSENVLTNVPWELHGAILVTCFLFIYFSMSKIYPHYNKPHFIAHFNEKGVYNEHKKFSCWSQFTKIHWASGTLVLKSGVSENWFVSIDVWEVSDMKKILTFIHEVAPTHLTNDIKHYI